MCEHVDDAEEQSALSPDDVLQEFALDFGAEDSREKLNTLLTAAFASHEADCWDGVDRSNLIFFCRSLENVIRAIALKYG